VPHIPFRILRFAQNDRKALRMTKRRCHPERSEGSQAVIRTGFFPSQILRCAQNDNGRRHSERSDVPPEALAQGEGSHAAYAGAAKKATPRETRGACWQDVWPSQSLRVSNPRPCRLASGSGLIAAPADIAQPHQPGPQQSQGSGFGNGGGRRETNLLPPRVMGEGRIHITQIRAAGDIRP